MRIILRNEPLEVTLVSATLSMCAFWKKASYEKFHDAEMFAREIVDDFSRSISPRISLLIKDSMLGLSCPVELRR